MKFESKYKTFFHEIAFEHEACEMDILPRERWGNHASPFLLNRPINSCGFVVFLICIPITCTTDFIDALLTEDNMYLISIGQQQMATDAFGVFFYNKV